MTVVRRLTIPFGGLFWHARWKCYNARYSEGEGVGLVVRQLAALMKKGVSPSNEEIARELAMGGRLGRLLDEWSLPGIVRRARVRA